MPKPNSTSQTLQVNWEDLGRSRMEVLHKSLKMYGIMFLLIVLCFGLTYFLHGYQEKLREETDGGVKAKLSAVLPGLVVATLNALLIVMSQYLAGQEYHPTTTSMEASVTVKMTMAMILNTAAVQVIIYNTSQEWFVAGGLVDTMIAMLSINSLVTPLFYLADYAFIFKQKMAKKIDLSTTKLPADKYYALWTPSELDLPRHYAISIKIFTVAVLFMPLFPISTLIGSCGIALLYWVGFRYDQCEPRRTNKNRFPFPPQRNADADHQTNRSHRSTSTCCTANTAVRT